MNSLALLAHEKPSLWCLSLWDQGLNDEKFPLKHLCSQQIIVLALKPSLCVVVSLLLRQNPCTALKVFFPQKRPWQNSCGAGRLGTSHRLSPGDVEQERSSVPGGQHMGRWHCWILGPELSCCVPIALCFVLGTGEPWVSHCCSGGIASGGQSAERREVGAVGLFSCLYPFAA